MEINDIMKLQTPSLKDMFKAFLKLGFTAFGGLLMIAYIKKSIIDKNKWLDERDFFNGVAFCQTIPGATVVQIASYIGLKLNGYKGALVSFIGFILPSLLFIILFSYFYSVTKNSIAAKEVFANLQTVIVALMLQAFFVISKMNIKNLKSFFLAVLGSILFWIGLNAFIVIILSAIIGVIIFNNTETPKLDSYAIKKNHINLENFVGILYLVFILTATALFSYIFNKNLFALIKTFIGVSIVSFGSGYSGTSLMFKEIVQNQHLISSHTFLNGMVFGRITPGPGMISVFIGFITFGLIGAMASLIAIYLPALIVLLSAEPIFDKLQYSQIFKKFILGILASFVGLVVNVLFTFVKLIQWDIKQVIIFIVSFVVLSFRISPIWVISTVVLLSIIYKFII